MNKTCTLEQAKRLKELGVEQKSTQWYADVNYDHPPSVINKEDFAAFDTDELFAMLPIGTLVQKIHEGYHIAVKYWSVKGDSLAIQLATLLIDCIGGKMIHFSIPEINERIKQYNNA